MIDTDTMEADLTTEIDANETKIDTAITNIAALNDISTADVNTQVDAALNTAIPGSPTAESINDLVRRCAGLMNDNIVYDDFTWSGDNQTAVSQYQYSTKANAQTHNKSTGLLGKWTMTVTWSGTKPTLIEWVRDS